MQTTIRINDNTKVDTVKVAVPPLPGVNDTDINDDYERLEDYKTSNRESYLRTGDGERHNTKESKKLRYKIHLARKRGVRRKCVPHGLSSDVETHVNDFGEVVCGPYVPIEEIGFGSFEESYPVVEKNPERELRNDLLRRAVSSKKLEADDSAQLNNLLESVSIAPELLGDEADSANEWVSYLENIVILGWHVHKAESFADIFVSIIGYIKMHTQRSIVRDIVQLIDSLTKDCKLSEVVPQGIDAYRIVDKWDLFKTNTIFTKVSYLITAAMSMTVCSVKKIEWSPFGLQLLALEAAKEQLKCVDVIDAVIHTFSWLCETGYRVFQEKSLLPILYSDSRVQKFNEDVDYIIANSEAILAGSTNVVIQDFEHKVDEALTLVAQLKAAKSNGPTSIWLQQKYSLLVDIKFKIVAKYKNTAIRVAPFGVGLTGPSGVGKSTLAKIVMKTALAAMDYDTDPTRIITKDMFDKYDSTYTSDILGMFMDDVGNGKAEFTENSPTDIIIKFFNNMAAQAVKAELNQKGVVFIGFKVGVLTSNFKDYQVRLYTDKPEAALRRFVHTRVHIKEKFRVPGGLSLDTQSKELNTDHLCQDIWDLDLEEVFVYESKEGKETYRFRPVVVKLNDGTPLVCKNLGLVQYLQAIIILAQNHKIRQDDVVKRSNEFDVMSMCGKCSLPQPICTCKVVPHGFDDIGDIVVNAAKTSVMKYVKKWINPVSYFSDWCGFKPLKTAATLQLSNEFSHALNTHCTPLLISLTPQFLFDTSLFQRAIGMWQHSAVMYDLKKPMKMGLFLGAGMLGISLYKKNTSMVVGSCFGTWGFSMIMWSHYRARLRLLQSEYLNRRNALPALMDSSKKQHVVKGTFMVAALLVGLKMFKLWNNARLASAKVQPAGNITPENMESNPGWFGFMMSKVGIKVGVQDASKRATPAQVVETLKKNNLFWADYKRSDGTTAKCNIFFPRKSVAWFPEHMFYPGCDFTKKACKSLEITVHRHNDVGGKFTFKTELAFCSTNPELDLACAYVPNCPDLPDKMKWLPTTLPSGTSTCTFLVRKGDTFSTDNISVDHCKTGHKYREFYGGTYGTDLAENGACMATLVLDQTNPVIMGFHIGGNTAHKLWSGSYGVMQTITLPVAEKLISDLSNIPGVVLSTVGGELPKTQYGIKIIESDKIHPHCMASKLTSENFVEVMGSTRLRSKQKSRVGPSILSEAVTEVTGIENQWGPAKLEPNWAAYNATLEHICNPTDHFEPSVLERARQDWLQPLISKMHDFKKTREFRVLTDKEVIMGIDEVSFIDPLQMSTGMGFPVFGPKKNHFTETRNGEVLIDRKPSAQILQEVERLCSCWKRNHRAYPINTATLKDEPTKLSSSKVRVFQAIPVAFSMMIRKYFLPVARFLTLHPELSECAVGVNSFSDQWDKLMTHAEKYSHEKKMLGWDYSKYDVRMTSQVVRAILISYIEICKAGGYSESDLTLMRAMIDDMTHPTLDYNGVLLKTYNGNPSGNNITVNINSTAGSLYVRMGFFNEFPDATSFRDCVSAMTYGDDFYGSVLQQYEAFNFKSFKKFLASVGMKITPPDKKEGEDVDFLHVDTCDFLKRKSQYIPEINTRIGKLDEMSIFKSLHCNVKSKNVTEREVATSCIEGAMHEWFAHGREVYELRAKQMREVCAKNSLPVPATHVTFDERVTHWLEKYT
jgi:hypothetical protein